MKIGIFNASDNTLAEAIQNDEITWVESQSSLVIMKPILAQTVYACANHSIGFIDGDIVEYLLSQEQPDNLNNKRAMEVNHTAKGLLCLTDFYGEGITPAQQEYLNIELGLMNSIEQMKYLELIK